MSVRTESNAGLREDPLYFKVMTEIDMIAHVASTQFEKLLSDDLTQAQFGVLNRLLRLHCQETVSELAAAFQVTQPTMSSTIKKLEAKGFVALQTDKIDRRIKRVKVTAAGAEARKRTIARLKPLFDDFDQWSTEIDWQRVLSALTMIRAYLEGD